MEIKEYCIYSLDFAYTRISAHNNVEIDFRGVLSYHTKDLELFSHVTKGILDLESVNVFLYFTLHIFPFRILFYSQIIGVLPFVYIIPICSFW